MLRTLYRLGDEAANALLRRWGVIVVVAALATSAVLLGIILFLDRILSPMPADAWSMVGIMAICALVFAILDWYGTVLSQFVSEKYLRAMHRLIARRAIELPLGYFSVDRSGEIAQMTVKGVVNASYAPGSFQKPLVYGVVSPMVAVIGAMFIEWRTALPLLISIPILVAIHRYSYTSHKEIERDSQRHQQDAAATILEFAQSQPIVRVAGPHSIAVQHVRSVITNQLRAAERLLLKNGRTLSALQTGTLLCMTVSLIIQVLLFANDSISIGILAGFAAFTFLVTKIALQAMPFTQGLMMVANTLDQIQELLDENLLPEPDAPATPADASIEFLGVDFAYVDGAPVLNDISFRVAPGTTTALVGPSGSGKTTLARLVARFYDVTGGEVRIGEANVKDLGTPQVASLVSMVFQDVYLFEDTLMENIRLGRQDATDAEVIRAAKIAGVAEFAERLPDGYQTGISEGGKNLSNGQRQRVSIARALLKDAPIVLLDEATSALDVENESLILSGLAALSGERTCIAIAHRMSTIASADQIVVLGTDGRIAAIGDHHTLLRESPTYASYWEDRQHGAGWQLRDSH